MSVPCNDGDSLASIYLRMGGARGRDKVARMSITETPVEVTAPVVFDIELGDERPHIECCRVTRFYCGAPYHPELSASEENNPDELCEVCFKILEDNECHRGHRHCPIPLLGWFICPES